MPSAVEVKPASRKNSTDGTTTSLHRLAEAARMIAPDKLHAKELTESDADQLVNLDRVGINDFPPGKPYSIAVAGVPTTYERRPYYPKQGDRLQDPGTARANIAASNESPHGTTQDNWAEKHKHQTVVQQHVAYWDKDNDGIITPLDTYRGFRAWGWALPLCLFATYIIHFALSYATLPTWMPDPLFRIHVANLHKDKHGSDSMTYDAEGRFRPQNFEDIFAKYDRGNKGGLDLTDLARLHKGQRMAMDFFGWSATLLEWLATYLLIWPEDGVMRKEDVRRIFDGSIFQQKADEYAEKQRKAKAGKSGKGGSIKQR